MKFFKFFLIASILTLFSFTASSQTIQYRKIKVYYHGYHVATVQLSYDNRVGETCDNNIKVWNYVSTNTYYNIRVYKNGELMYSGRHSFDSQGYDKINDAFYDCDSSSEYNTWEVEME